jgi:hypothetical protein
MTEHINCPFCQKNFYVSNEISLVTQNSDELKYFVPVSSTLLQDYIVGTYEGLRESLE